MNRKAARREALPQGWRKVRLHEVASVKTGPFGTQLHQHDYVQSNGTPIITVEHLSERGLIHNNLPLVSDPDKQRLSQYLIREGDIVFSRVGSVDRSALVKKDEDGWLFSGRLLRLRPRKDDVHSPYLNYFFHTKKFRHHMRSIAVGGIMPSLNTSLLSNVIIQLPPLPEQKAIASILETWDTAIQKTETLITTKLNRFKWLSAWMINRIEHRQNIKKIQLGRILKYEQPTKYLVKSAEYTNDGETPVLTANKSFILGYTEEREGIYDKLPVIIFDDFTTESKFVDFPFKMKSSAMKILSPLSSTVDLGYVFLAMQRIKIAMGGHKRYWISEFQFFDIPLPPLHEQQCIANTLNTAQYEIVLLKKKIEQFRIQKLVLMQKLLTGQWKTRL